MINVLKEIQSILIFYKTLFVKSTKN